MHIEQACSCASIQPPMCVIQCCKRIHPITLLPEVMRISHVPLYHIECLECVSVSFGINGSCRDGKSLLSNLEVFVELLFSDGILHMRKRILAMLKRNRYLV